MEVELKEKWEPSDGEIYFTNTDYAEYIFIAKKILSDHIATDVILRDKDYLSVGFDFDVFKEKTNLFRPATDSEKQLLFDALAKKGKMWDRRKRWWTCRGGGRREIVVIIISRTAMQQFIQVMIIASRLIITYMKVATTSRPRRPPR